MVKVVCEHSGIEFESKSEDTKLIDAYEAGKRRGYLQGVHDAGMIPRRRAATMGVTKLGVDPVFDTLVDLHSKISALMKKEVW